MSELFFVAIRVHGSLDVVVTARGEDEDAVIAAHELAMAGRPKSSAGGSTSAMSMPMCARPRLARP